MMDEINKNNNCIEKTEKDDYDSYEKHYYGSSVNMEILGTGELFAKLAAEAVATEENVISESPKQPNWSTVKNNALIKKYKKYILQVKGYNNNKSARFLTKNSMFAHIATELSNEYNWNITGYQCSNRLKTIIRRRKKFNYHLRDNNKSRAKNISKKNFEIVYVSTDGSVNKSTTVPVITASTTTTTIPTKQNNYHYIYQNQENKIDFIAKKNDEVIKHVVLPEEFEVRPSQHEKSMSGALFVRETMLEIHKMQEENKDRRHREWMDMWKKYLNIQIK